MTSLVSALALVASAAVLSQPSQPASNSGPAPAATAVRRALPLLQASADTWFARRQCGSCHHQALGIIAVTVARERGFAVDEPLVKSQLERFLQPRRNWQENYVTAEVSINEAIGQSYRAVGIGTAGGTPTAMTDAIGYLLAGRQHVSGRWSSYSRRPPLEDSEFTATALTIRALSLFPLKGREAETRERIARGRQWLAGATPADTEDRGMQLLGLAWAGAAPVELRTRADALLAEQRADGGWAQIATRASDAYATGLAIVALNQAARIPIGDARMRRGLDYLVATQQTDGSWRVPTRRTFSEGLPYFESGYPHGADQFISYAGAAWATTALALADRDAPSPAFMGQPAASGPASPASDEPDGLTPLMRAALYGSLADVTARLAAGDDVNEASPDGVTALMCAVHDAAKVARLLEAGANPNAETRLGHSALQLAAGYAGARASVDLLLARGVSVDRVVTGGNFAETTALARAVARGDAGIAAALVARGASVGPVKAHKQSPLIVAVWHGDADMADWPIARGASPDETLTDEFGDKATPLMFAVQDGRVDLVRLLLARGAAVDAVDGAGLSALLYAAIAIDRGVDSTAIVEALLKAGAKKDVTGPDGSRPAALARKWHKPHVAARLE